MPNSQGIEGVPIGAKVVRVGKAACGDFFLGFDGQIMQAKLDSGGAGYIILQPDNIYNRFLHEVEEDIKKAGRERLGGDDYRIPKKGETYWYGNFVMLRSNNDWKAEDGLVLILKSRTKKVLVETREWSIGEDVGVNDYSPITAEKLVAGAPTVYRIETRPA